MNICDDPLLNKVCYIRCANNIYGGWKPTTMNTIVFYNTFMAVML